jgi:hypothetical protein
MTIGPSLLIVVRYSFTVDGVAMADPRNEPVLASAGTVQSRLVVPSAAGDFAAEKSIPHGMVARSPSSPRGSRHSFP